MKLGRLGVWYSTDKLNGAQLADFAGAVEKNGYAALWYPESRGYETVALASYLLSKSEKLLIGSSIANIYARDAFTARRAMVSLNDLHGGRFILGLGVSHEHLVSSLGQAYTKPLGKMEKFLDALDHPAEYGADSELPPVVLAALGPRMLTLSAERTAGAHPYFAPPEHTAYARSVLGSSSLLVPEQALSLAADQTEGLAAGRAYAQRYLRAPNYTRNLKRFGFDDPDFADGGSGRLIEAIIPSGAATVLDRVRAHLDAGADHVLLQPLDENGKFAGGQLDELAAAVAELMKRS